MPAATRINRRVVRRLPMILLVGIMAAACAMVVPSRAAAATGVTVSLQASNTNPIAGAPITFTATITPSDGSTVNGGTVSILDTTGRSWGTATVANGTATVVLSGGMPAGTFQVQASYSGTSTYAKAKSPFIAITVGSNALPRTQTVLTANNSTITAGDSVTFSITVTDRDTGTIPSGTVTLTASAGGTQVSLFPNNQVDVGPSNNGTGTITDTFAPAGTYTIIAQFQGSQYQPSADQFVLVVNPPKATTTTTTTTLIANGGAITVSPDTPVTLNATIIQNVAVIPPAGDIVNFYRQITNGYKDFLGQGTLTWDTTDGSQPATGHASIQTGSWPRGQYSVSAEFVGDAYDFASSGQIALGVSGPIPTATTYVGDLTGTTGNPFTLTGKLVDNQGMPLPNEPLTLSLNNSPSETCTATTGSAGVASCKVTELEGQGSYPVTASFAGDGDYQPSSGSDTALISGPAITAMPTSLPYQGQYTAVAGSNETLKFKLTDNNGNPLASQSVQISVDGQSFPPPVTTDANGYASLQVNLPAGTHAVSALFNGATVGTKQYQPSNGSGSIVVTKLPTTLTYLGPSSVTVGTQANVQFKLTDQNGNPLAGKSVAITVNGVTISVTTDANGIATAPQNLPAGTYPISASFNGTSDPVYDSSTGPGSLTVNKIPTTTTGTTNPAVNAGTAAVLSATLVDVNGAPIGGRTVTLSFGANAIDNCSGVTNAQGQVSCITGAVQSPASTTPYVVNATFGGDDKYLSSAGTGSIVINRAVTTIVDNVTGNFLLGSPITLSGTLTANGSPVAGKTLTLTFGTASCTGVTGANGTATCPLSGGVPGPTGPTTTSASFAGDTNYTPATDTKPALVYAYASGSGNFVVGDLTATGPVYFWGSQWWKQNVLSQGDPQAQDPAAFKGFEDFPSIPQCGQTWATDPGNSTPPPNGPLPAYMAIIVSSQNHKVPGPIISGNVVHIVIVKTNAGYDGNPGHDGTGTVVATVC